MAMRVMCGVPAEHCTGGTVQHGPMNRGVKAHGSNAEAYACRVRYLIKQGYKKVGPHTYAKGNGPAIILTKASHYGLVLRPNKEGRWMPKSDPHGRGGIIPM